VEHGHVTAYTGNYTTFSRLKEEALELQEKRWEEQQRFLKRNREFMDRFRYKATKARAVRSREKMIEKIDMVEAPVTSRKKIRFSFRMDHNTRQDALSFKNLVKSFPGKTIRFEGEVQLSRGDKVALVGPNGVGKSTLMRLLAGLDRADGGRINVDTEAQLGYYSQLQSETLDHDRSPLEEIEEAVEFSVTREEIRRRLGCFLLSGDAALKRIDQLSGGEKARVALALLTLRSVNLMLLDEPTNHLDILSRDVLAEAIAQFEGTIVLISHDRYFLDQTVNKVLALDGETVRLYLGNYTDYFQKRKRELRQTASLPPKIAKKPPTRPVASPRAKEPDPRTVLFLLEDEIEKKENELRAVEDELGTPEVYGDPERQLAALKKYQVLKEGLQELNTRWEECMAAAQKATSERSIQ
jgi:ATP-binding cassette subfamily F protein 3